MTPPAVEALLLLQECTVPFVQQSIDIAATPDFVFDLIANQPERMPDWWPPMTAQERVTPPPTQVGSVSRFTYTMLGLKINGEHRVTTLEPGERLIVTTESGVEGAFDFLFQPLAAGMRLTLRVDYKLPGLDAVPAIEQRNEIELTQGLANLKQIAEAEFNGNR